MIKFLVVAFVAFYFICHWPDFRVGYDLLRYDLTHQGKANVRY